MNSIPHVPLAADRLNECIHTLLVGNPRARFWATRLLGSRRGTEFHRWLDRGGVNPDEVNRSGEPLSAADQTAFAVDLQLMRAVASVEPALLHHHADQLHRQARAFAGRLHNPLLDKDECLSLSLETFHRVTRSYTSDEVPFGHFLARAVRNRLRRAAFRQRPLPLPRRHCQLLLAYDRTLVRLGLGAPFEDVVAHLGLSEEDVRRLREARIRICSFSQLPSDDRYGESLAAIAPPPEVDGQPSLAASLELVLDLSPNERLLLEEALHDPPRGWKAAAARRLGVSRPAITKILRQGWRKFQHFLHTHNPCSYPIC